MSSAQRYEEMAESWLEGFRLQTDAFEEAMKRREYLSYDLIGIRNSEGITDWDDLDPACHRCIFDHIHKYEEFIFSDNKPVGKRFLVNCRGIPREYISDEMLKSLGVERGSNEYDQVLSTLDPVAWAYLNCRTVDSSPLVCRWYQEVMTRCTAKRKAYRCGRRTGKTVALDIVGLWNALIQPFFTKSLETGEILRHPETGELLQRTCTVLYITPRQSHADNLISEIEWWMQKNDMLNGSLTVVSTPYYVIEAKNGSKLICLTAGTGTAAAGLSIRSFSADIVILDEADYLGEAELKATRAILMTNEHAILIASSTPTGFHNTFYKWCEENPLYKSFHFPSMLLPHWDKIRHSVYGDVETEEEFSHEYMAVFSRAGTGVFRPDLVKASQRVYVYETIVPHPNWVYSIGVDWNSVAGTEIYTNGIDPDTGEYLGVSSICVPQSEWTQLEAVRVLLEEVVRWCPAAVVIDLGYGHTQYELLKQYALERGYEHKAIAELLYTLIPFQFGGNIEVKDPETNFARNVPAKAYLVQNAIRRLEERNVFLSSFDLVLIRQLLGYSILKVSLKTGYPVYGPGVAGVGDHRLDAWMLSLVGFKLKFGSLHIGPQGIVGSVDMDRNEYNIEGTRYALPDLLTRRNESERYYYEPDEDEKKPYHGRLISRTEKLPNNKMPERLKRPLYRRDK